MKTGRHSAKITDYSVSESQAGDPMLQVRFKFKGNDDGSDCEWNWYGSFKEGKAREITLKALVVMGFVGDEFEKLCDGPVSNCLDMNKEVSIETGNEEYNGKTSYRINWVNEPGGGAMRDAMDKGKAKIKFGGMNLKAEMMSIRQGAPKPVATAAPVNPADIPF